MKVIRAKDKQGQLAGTTRVIRGTDAARLMQRIYSIVDQTLDDLEDGSLPADKKAAAIGTLAKTVKEMADIEDRRDGRVAGKSVKEISDAELRQLAAGILEEDE